jgi:hypothetical protein
MRGPVVAVVGAIVVAAVGAVILGEYDLSGFRGILSGVIFGVTVAEVIATVAKPGPDERPLEAAAALITEAGLVWATWISTGHQLDDAAGMTWVGVALGAVAAPLWVRGASRRAGDTTDGPAPAPAG